MDRAYMKVLMQINRLGFLYLKTVLTVLDVFRTTGKESYGMDISKLCEHRDGAGYLRNRKARQRGVRVLGWRVSERGGTPSLVLNIRKLNAGRCFLLFWTTNRESESGNGLCGGKQNQGELNPSMQGSKRTQNKSGIAGFSANLASEVA